MQAAAQKSLEEARESRKQGVKRAHALHDEETANVPRLWPSTSEFYRAVLRWVHDPHEYTIEEDELYSVEMRTVRVWSTSHARLCSIYVLCLQTLAQDVGNLGPHSLHCVQSLILVNNTV